MTNTPDPITASVAEAIGQIDFEPLDYEGAGATYLDPRDCLVIAHVAIQTYKAKMREVGVNAITQKMKSVPLEQLESLDDTGYARIAIAALFDNEARSLILGDDA